MLVTADPRVCPGILALAVGPAVEAATVPLLAGEIIVEVPLAKKKVLFEVK